MYRHTWAFSTFIFNDVMDLKTLPLSFHWLGAQPSVLGETVILCALLTPLACKGQGECFYFSSGLGDSPADSQLLRRSALLSGIYRRIKDISEPGVTIHEMESHRKPKLLRTEALAK